MISVHEVAELVELFHEVDVFETSVHEIEFFETLPHPSAVKVGS